MYTKERIARYGVAAYTKKLVQSNTWRKAHPEEAKANEREQSNKGGKYYDKILVYDRTGLQRVKNQIRRKHRQNWCLYKNIIAPGSQIHHEWIPGTADYRGVALVEADQHMHGVIDVIEILKGRIRLLTEVEVKRRKKMNVEEVQRIYEEVEWEDAFRRLEGV